MKKLLAALTALCAAGAAFLAIPAFGATRTVAVRDSVFSPKTVSVSRGTTVRWVWRGSLPHNVVVTRGPARFKSTVKTKGSYSKTVTRRGTYTIVCQIHPGMTMKLRVG